MNLKTSNFNSVHKRGINAENVGTIISQEQFKDLKENFEVKFPELPSSVSIPRKLIGQVLGHSNHPKGIRFMYGLDDLLNPNSVQIFLVPCTSLNDDSIGSAPIISNMIYLDHHGVSFSLKQMARRTFNWVKYISAFTPEQKYKELTRGNFFGKNILNEYLADNEFQSLLFNFGYENKSIRPVLQRLNEFNEIYADETTDNSWPCPSFCPGSPETCFMTLAAELNADQTELNQIRAFRDKVMLGVEEGGTYFEMYYLVSPQISRIINSLDNRNEILTKLYENKIVKFKQLLQASSIEEASDFMKETLDGMVKEYAEI